MSPVAAFGVFFIKFCLKKQNRLTENLRNGLSIVFDSFRDGLSITHFVEPKLPSMIDSPSRVLRNSCT